MKTSGNGRAFIEAFEGRYLKAYDDSTGVWTIGFGHTTAAGPPKVVPGMTITGDQADQFLAADLAAVEITVGKLIRSPLTQPQFDALVSFEFNTGDLSKSSIVGKVNARNNDAAMAALLLYNHAGEPPKEMAGLTRRRKAERLMFLGDVTGAMTLAGAHVLAGDTMPQAPKPPPTLPPPDIPTPEPAPKSGFFLALIKAFLALFMRTK